MSIVGTKSYSLLRNLLAPESPSSKSVGELLDALQSHLQPEPVVIAERYKFYQRSQNSDESVVAFIAELKRLAATCDFKTHLDEALHDRLVCGLRSVGARKKLLGQKDLTFHKAVELATTHEAIEANSQAMANKFDEPPPSPTVIHWVKSEGRPQESSLKSCFRCGRSGHSPDICHFKNARCFNCRKLGHISAVCKVP